MALRRSSFARRQQALPAPPISSDDRQLGHVICAALYQDRCTCANQGREPCDAMQLAASDVERFLAKQRSAANRGGT
ncbi:MAG: hypothetical protein DI537_10280 [Stutzerimonas stutzeri]|nr:MAG: hypothetical protein DI537_10280 [Stutzerimonas stutzeri]